MSEGTINTPIPSAPDPAIAKENRIKTAAGAFGAFCMAQKLSDEEFLFAIMLSIVPVLAAYPRDLENRFNKALTKELKMHRKLLLQMQAEKGANKEAQEIADNKEQAYAKENTAQP